MMDNLSRSDTVSEKKKLSIDNLDDGEIDQSLLSRVEVYSDLFSQLVDQCDALSKKVHRLESTLSESSASLDPTILSRLNFLEREVKTLTGASSTGKKWESASNLPEDPEGCETARSEPAGSESAVELMAETATATESRTATEPNASGISIPFYQSPFLTCTTNKCMYQLGDSHGKIVGNVKILKPDPDEIIYLWKDEFYLFNGLKVKEITSVECKEPYFKLRTTPELLTLGKIECEFVGNFQSYTPTVVDFKITFDF